MRFKLRDAASGEPPAAIRSDPSGGPADGIRYRTPGRGRLVAKPQSAGDVILFTEEPIPQFGRLMLRPFSNGPFQSNTIEAKFNENGTLQLASYGDRTSRAEAASKLAADLAGRASSTINDLATARNAGLARQTARTNARIDALKAEQQLRDAQAVFTVDPNSLSERTRRLLAADTALREAQEANIKARLALAAETAKAREAGVELP